MERILHLLANDDVYSPLILLAGGLLGLFFFNAFRWFVSRVEPMQVGDWQGTLRRFEKRSRVSWVLVAFGALWLLQLVVERAWAR